MKIGGPPFAAIVWEDLPEAQSPGSEGTARARGVEFDGIRVRRVRYSAGYRADHWCGKGHVLLVLEGVLAVEFQDGSSVMLDAGAGCYLADDVLPHRAATTGASVVFIVD